MNLKRLFGWSSGNNGNHGTPIYNVMVHLEYPPGFMKAAASSSNGHYDALQFASERLAYNESREITFYVTDQGKVIEGHVPKIPYRHFYIPLDEANIRSLSSIAHGNKGDGLAIRMKSVPIDTSSDPPTKRHELAKLVSWTPKGRGLWFQEEEKTAA